MNIAGPKRPKNWLTTGNIGEYCQVSTATIRRWIKKGELLAVQLPSGHYRVSTVDFRDFLKRHNLPVRNELLKSESRKEGGNA
jgi:excisionase family DNA binding protein